MEFSSTLRMLTSLLHVLGTDHAQRGGSRPNPLGSKRRTPWVWAAQCRSAEDLSQATMIGIATA